MKKIGWIGAGVMGKSMCIHIMNAVYKVFEKMNGLYTEKS